VIGSSSETYNTLGYGFLEVGLLLHFSPNGLRFYRQVHSADRKQSIKSGSLVHGSKG
jgi:hypothetical protein